MNDQPKFVTMTHGEPTPPCPTCGERFSQIDSQRATIERLEAKLKIAVEALEKISQYPWKFYPNEKAQEALAKIRGCE